MSEQHKKAIYINELTDGQPVDDIFQVRNRELRLRKNNNGRYLSLVLGDRTGEIQARMWEADDLETLPEPGQVVRIRAQVTTYRGDLQLTLNGQIEAVPEDYYDLADFLPHTGADKAQLIATLMSAIAGIQNPYLRELLNSIFEDPRLSRVFYNAPAAKTHHHAYIGGLLEHTVNVLRIVQAFAEIYSVDADLLITGAILHDVGKTVEYSYVPQIGYTDEGRLLGHIMIGAQIIAERAAAIGGFPKDLLIALQHMILSHHGEYEWQSARRPKFLEAQLLHFADLTDSKAAMFNQANQEDDPWVWAPGLSREVTKYCPKGEEE